MGIRDELIASYAEDLRTKCGMTPDMDLLTKVTLGCGPLIYHDNTNYVDAASPAEIKQIKRNYLIKKLSLRDGPELDDGIDVVMEIYNAERKYRVVVYYMLTKHFGKEAYYK